MSDIKPRRDDDGVMVCHLDCHSICDDRGFIGCLCRPYYARQAAQAMRAWVAPTCSNGLAWFPASTSKTFMMSKPVLIIPDDERDER